ncbi:Imm15 family immunity protein [Erwinia sp. ErVv1]|uniref:Imm15 family immunity protein n=1 Tax=Erwinia sp. ErVv1 TaxID=1603299 RepID=UPI00082E7C5E|nr:Imm15 family immunity protein [Erwinia sp. ErVv1]
MSDIDKKIHQLIKKEGLDDPDIFLAEYDTFEEVPFFSRWNDIKFLSHLSFDEKNKILLKSAIDLVTKNQRVINSIITNSQLADFFACITLTGWDDALEMGSLKPNILFTRRKNWLLSNLNLKRSGVPEENLTKDYLSSISAFNFKALTSDGFDNNKRVYVIADLNSTL